MQRCSAAQALAVQSTPAEMGIFNNVRLMNIINSIWYFAYLASVGLRTPAEDACSACEWWRDAISLREYKRPWCVPRWFYVKFPRSVSVSSASSALGSMCRVLGAREIDMLFLRLLTAHLHSPAKWYWVHGYFRLNRPRECVSYFARRITKHIDRPSSCPACLGNIKGGI